MDRFLDKKVAIIGMACRFPGGADNPREFWKLLKAGKNVVTDIPGERWQADRFFNEDNSASAKSYVRKGHFIDWDYRSFDAGFFNFAPREVEYFDPQQRLMLEVSWEAMENAGLDVSALAGSATGVYVGGFTLDHMLNQMGSSARSEIGAHSAAGATLTMLSNRLSYAYDFRGPSISVDTACSSSLVAFSYAVNDIRSGAASMALVGGVNMMLRPEYPIAMSKGQFLARDGRSKSFDARADGYGRGEGAGLVVLKSLEAALNDGDRVLAVVDGAGVNQDGRTNGITVPNAASQKALMNSVVDAAQIDPGSVQYVEAHGTGTPVGDPLEASAIASVYGADRDAACRIGSLKSNIGHLEAAAGIAAVIKACLMLNENQVPAIAGLEQPNPAIPFGDNGLELASTLSGLAAEGDTRRIAINSFGYGGTNAHAILSRCQDLQWLDARKSQERKTAMKLLPLSAQDGQALQQMARNCAAELKDSSNTLEDILFTLSRRRTHLGHRLAVWGSDRHELAQSLEAFACDGSAEKVRTGVQPFTGNMTPVFVFTGMGPQWWGMGQALYRDNPAYRLAVDEADSLFRDIAGFSIRDEMLKSEQDSRITETALAQPANFVIQYGLTCALAAEGLAPAAVVGHSVGEITSAWAAGMLSLRDALLVACERSRIQATAAGQGGMLAVGLGFEEVVELIAADADKVSVAAVNSPGSVTLAGDQACLDRLQSELEERDVFARALTVEVPYHSPMMEPLKPALMERLDSLSPAAPQVPLYSTVTGQRVKHERYDAAYWCRNVREPVFFAKTVDAMLDDGYRVFVEIGPHPVLRSALKETFAGHGTDARSVQTLNRKQPELQCLYAGLADAFCQGGKLHWAARHPVGQLVSLPNYPWQRQLLWREAEAQRHDRMAAVERPLLGVRDAGMPSWRADLADHRLDYLLEHVVDGMAIMPAAAYVETMLEAVLADNDGDSVGCRLANIAIDKALILDSAEPRFTALSLTSDGRRASLHSFDERKPGKRVRHAVAQVFPLAGDASAGASGLPDASHLTVTRTRDEVYESYAAFAMQYGPRFQPIAELRLDEKRTEVLARLELPEALNSGAADYVAHPSLLDGCLQTVLSLLNPDEGAFLPTLIRELKIHRRLSHRLWCHGKLTRRSGRTVECDLTLMSETGEVEATLRGLVCSALKLQRQDHSYPAGDLACVWKPEALVAAAPVNRNWLVVSTDDAWPTAPLFERLSQDGSVRFVDLHDEDAEQALATMDCDAVAFLAGAGFGDNDPVGEAASAALLTTLQVLARRERVPRLYTITRNAFRIAEDDAPPIPAQGSLAGMMRVAFNELGHQPGSLRATTVDLPRIVDDALVDRLVDELQANDEKDEIALRQNGRHYSEIMPSGLFAEMPATRVNPARGDRFVMRSGNESDGVTLATALPAPLGDDELELAIESAGLDAGAAAAWLQGDDEGGRLMSMCARVSRVGGGRDDVSVGDRVGGFVPVSLASHVRIGRAQSLLVPVPDHVPARWVTASAAPAAVAQVLADFAMLSAGDRIVVCTTAKGSALARILSARGVVVTTLPGNPAEWTSTELERAVAGGAPTAIAAPLAEWERLVGFDSLAAGGCLIDLGTDFSPLQCAARVGRLVRIDPALEIARGGDQLASAMTVMLKDDVPTVVPAACDVELLTRQPLATLGERGQLVIDMQPDVELPALASDNPGICDDAAYLVTGGFGGLGKETARWLLHQGAGHVALCGRRAGASEADKAFLAELREAGFSVSAHQCDLADLARVTELVDSLSSREKPLRGIFHTAGVLRDRPLAELDTEALACVMQPKARGAWNLHLATARLPLDHFVLYSSISVLVGNSNQANYCAANGFLDTLAHYRRAHGLAAMSLNWGAIDTVGMLSQDEMIGRHLRQIGLTPISFDVALNGMARAMSSSVTQVCIASNPDWKKWSSYETHGGHSPRFRTVVTQAREQADDSVQARLRQQLVALDDEQRREVLSGLIAEIFARELKTPADQLDPAMPLDFLGVDSLMATEIRVSLDTVLGLSVSELELADNGSIARLASKWHEQMNLDQTAAA